MGEILLLAAIALIVIGPRQLPEVARTIGRLLNQFRDASNEFQRAFFEIKNEAEQSVTKFQSAVERSLESPQPDPQRRSEPQASLPPSKAAKADDEEKQLSFDLNKEGS